MQRIVGFLIILAAMTGSVNYAFSQDIGLATFQETAQVLIDKSISQNVTASITLQSTSVQEIKIPPELEQKIRENEMISAVVLTNQNQCVLGVDYESCILINVKRDQADTNFLQIQNSTLQVSEGLIDQINEAFDTNAELHSTFIHSNDDASQELETSGIISGRGTISAVYTMPMEDTASMYEKMSAMLIPREIRDSGGFYDVARDLTVHENSKMTLSIIPTGNKSLIQLKVSVDYPNTAKKVSKVNPLEFLQTDELKRSEYFSSGFYPLNSIVQVIVLSPEETSISEIKGDMLQTRLVDGQKIPVEITKPGWVFDPDQGTRIQGKYIFGDTVSIRSDELVFSFAGSDHKTEPTVISLDESTSVVLIITTIAIAAAAFYLKGYKR